MTLSQNEYIIMQLLWSENRPLSRAEILKGTPSKNWNPASVHLILNSMISKGAIKITDEEKTYGRTYEALLSQREYILSLLRAIYPEKNDDEIIISTVNCLIYNGDAKAKDLERLQKLIDKQKE